MRAKTLGRYRLEEPIGHGGMAIVYRAHDPELDRVVAIKILADNLAGDDTFRRRFVREARLAARLSHPNVVRVFDSGEEDDRPYIVMEHVDGRTLAAIVAREGPLEVERAVELTRQACAGLQHAHDHGVVHRDVKPQNLLVRHDGLLKIGDFGIARSATGTRLTEIGSILGTAAYLAPEQAAGAEVTAAADVYGLGIVLYELLAGQTPYSYESLTELLVDQRQQPVPDVRALRPEVPPPLEDVLMRCLARIPEYRPTAAELAAALGGGAEAPTVPLPAPTKRRRTAASRPLASLGGMRAAAAAAVALLLVGGIALVGSLGDDAPPPVPAPVSKPPIEQARDLSAWLRETSR